MTVDELMTKIALTFAVYHFLRSHCAALLWLNWIDLSTVR